MAISQDVIAHIPRLEAASDLQSWSRFFSAWTASWRDVGFHREYLMYLHANAASHAAQCSKV